MLDGTARDLPYKAVEGKKAASVPLHAGDGAGDRGEAGVDPPLPLEALGDDIDAMQDAGVLANQHGSYANLRARLMAMRAVTAIILTVVNLTVLPDARHFSGESAGEDGARARAYVATFGDLFAPGEDAIHQRVRQGLGRMTTNERAPTAPDELAIERGSPGGSSCFPVFDLGVDRRCRGRRRLKGKCVRSPRLDWRFRPRRSRGRRADASVLSFGGKRRRVEERRRVPRHNAGRIWSGDVGGESRGRRRFP